MSLQLERRQTELIEQIDRAIAAAQGSTPWDDAPCIQRFEKVTSMSLADLLGHPNKWAVLATK